MGSTANFCAVTASFLIAQPIAAAVDLPAAVDVRVAEGYAPSVVQAIARIAAPTAVSLGPEQSVRKVIDERCGGVDPAYIAAFLDENRAGHPRLTAEALESAAAGVTFLFPYCIRPVSRPVRVGDKTISSFYDGQNIPFAAADLQSASSGSQIILPRSLTTIRLFRGRANAGSDRGFVATENARRFLAENPGIRPNELQPDDKIKVDPGVRAATVPLRMGVSVESAMAELAATEANVEVAEAVPAELIGNESLRAGECAGSENKSWPIDLVELKKALSHLKDLRPRPSGANNRPPAQVLLIDTGYDPAFKEPALPGSLLGTISGPDPESVALFYGINAVDPLKMDPNPPAKLTARLHGGEVAATLVGSRMFGSLNGDMPLPRVTFASLATIDSAGRPYLDVSAFSRAYMVAVNNDVQIVNASVAASKWRQDFLDLIQYARPVLMIAAAGNVAAPPQEFTVKNQTWPGSMGGHPQGAGKAVVVSVGAHDPVGKLLYFSRKGPQVDILAPGCRIPTYTLDADGTTIKETEGNGTSYAAPIVSLVASILSREGLRPSLIKDRFIVSADVDERVADTTWSGGRLNIRRALSIWRDYIEYETFDANNQPVIESVSGKLGSGARQLKLCNAYVNHAALRKLTYSTDPTNPSTKPVWRGWKRSSTVSVGTTLERLPSCEAGGNAIEGDDLVIITDDNVPVPIKVSRIREYVAGIPQ